MQRIKIGGLAFLLGMMTLATTTLGVAATAPDGTIAAQPISYADLGKLVRSYRGKVIVVDFWSYY